MKINIFFKFLIVLFVLLPFSKGEIVRATNYVDVLIIEDSENNYSVTDGIKNVLGFYGVDGTYIKDNDYNLGQVSNYDKVIIISNNSNIENIDLISDLKNFQGKIFWIGSGVSQILDSATKQTYSVVWNVDNIWNMVIIPNESESFLTLTEAFNSFFAVENTEGFKTFLKITDVSILSDSSKLKEIADYLYNEQTPFVIVINEVANIKNLNSKENGITYYKAREFLNTVKYMVNKGGSVIIKNNSDDYDTPNSLIRKNYLADDKDKEDVLKNFIKECVKHNIYPLGVEVSSLEEVHGLKNNFSTLMYSLGIDKTFQYPFVITDNENSYNIITENIGSIDSNNKAWLQEIEYNIKKISKVRGSTGVISYSSNLDIEYLKELIKNLKKADIEYISLKDRENIVDLGDIKITSSKGDISYIIDSYNEEDILNKNYENHDLEKNFFQTKLNIVLIISMVTLSVLFVVVYYYCKNDNNNKVA